MENKRLLEKLRTLEIHRVEASYYGSGDQGCIEYIDYYGSSDEAITPDDPDLFSLIEKGVCELLTEQWPGWEIDEGSTGTATIQVVDGRIEIDHDQHYIETNSDTYEGEL
jgi:hypothetical protein